MALYWHLFHLFNHQNYNHCSTSFNCLMVRFFFKFCLFYVYLWKNILFNFIKLVIKKGFSAKNMRPSKGCLPLFFIFYGSSQILTCKLWRLHAFWLLEVVGIFFLLEVHFKELSNSIIHARVDKVFTYCTLLALILIPSKWVQNLKSLLHNV